jgi:hypothetical protein
MLTSMINAYGVIAMCDQIVQSSAGLAGPSRQPALFQVTEVLRSSLQRIASWRERFKARAGKDRMEDVMPGMNERMLRDIGAPGRVIAQAATLREQERQYRENAFIGRIL